MVIGCSTHDIRLPEADKTGAMLLVLLHSSGETIKGFKTMCMV